MYIGTCKFAECISRDQSSTRFGKVTTMVGSIVVTGVLTGCALLHSVCDLKAEHINVQCSLIRKLILIEL